jgi:hypothetical protein
VTGWAPHALLATLLFAGAWEAGPRTPRHPAELGRALAAPLLLPFLWGDVGRALRRGDTTEAVARGHLLLQLAPCWTSGYVWLAHEMTFGTQPAADPTAVVDATLAALLLLDGARARGPGGRPEEIPLAQAFLVETRIAGHRELDDELRRRIGRSALEQADEYLRAAEAVASRDRARVARAYLTKRMVGLALEDDDQPRALRTAELALARLAEVEALQRAAGQREPAENAAAHRAALARLRDWLRGDPSVSTAILRADPYLEDLADTLPH